MIKIFSATNTAVIIEGHDELQDQDPEIRPGLFEGKITHFMKLIHPIHSNRVYLIKVIKQLIMNCFHIIVLD